MRVAESIVILAPIDHVGWPGRRPARPPPARSAVASRNGPPDAVSISRATASIAPPPRHCQMAECSESIGRTQASGLAMGSAGRRGAHRGREPPGQRHHEVAAGHQRLLVGGRHDLARREVPRDRTQAHDAAGRHDHEVDVGPGRQPLEGVGPRASSCPAGRSSRRGGSGRPAPTAAGGAGGPAPRGAPPVDRRPGPRPGTRRPAPRSTSRAWRPIEPVEPRSATRTGPGRGRPALEEERERRTGSRPGAANRNESMRSRTPP